MPAYHHASPDRIGGRAPAENVDKALAAVPALAAKK
jgi:hypothetical protein